MSVSFDWDFKEESETPRRPDSVPPGRRRRWLIRGAIVLVVFFLVGLLVRAWVVGRLKSVEKDEAELRATVELELRTIAQGDTELFRSLQDPVNPTWQEQQIDRYLAPDAAQFVPAPGLVPSDRSPEIKRVHFFGHTGRAEMTHWFEDATLLTDDEASSPDGRSEPLPFHVTWFYRQDEDGNWYHVDPPGDYWGIPYSWHGNRLEVRATEIEAERIDPTARELAILVSQVCLWAGCPEGARYTLSFEDISAPEVRGDVWALPALYLTGMPEDEEAWEAWQHALKLWMVEMLARDQVDDEELAERAIYRQLVTRLKARLGLTEEGADLLPTRYVSLLTNAVNAREQHPLWSLWQAKAGADDPNRASLIEVEVTVLLEYIEGEVGSRELFRLLPALAEYSRFSDALQEVYGLDQVEFSSGWLDHLSNLTGVSIVPEFPGFGFQLLEVPLEAPPTPPPPATPPGDHIAVNCGGQIWVGNADGSDMVPLTVHWQYFNNLIWSPDGRWLLTMWHPVEPLGELYLLAADGSGGRLLTDAPAVQAWPLAWSPDGREAIYYLVRFGTPGQDSVAEVHAVDVETGETRQLPGMPVWSPDGEKLLYVTLSSEGPVGSAWLANANWEDAHPIEPRAWIWPGQIWSPDSSKLALALPGDVTRKNGTSESAIAAYDVATERLLFSFTATELTTAFLSAEDGFVTDGSDRAALADRPLTWLSVYGWSADGRHLLVWAHGRGNAAYATGPVALAAIPLDAFETTWGGRDERSEPRLLAYGEERYITTSWSPTNANRLVFTWVPLDQQVRGSASYLVDLDAGPVYSATRSLSASWSPDGAWVAFGGQGGVTITDQDGQVRFELPIESDLVYQIAWNPTADLSGLVSIEGFSGE